MGKTEASPTAPPSGKRLPELDGLRGMAILMVFLLHYISDSRTNNGEFGTLYRFAQIFRLGWSGVDLFFVLSGFLIGGILLDARASPSYFKTFYVRRVHRILPICYAWITAYGLFGYAARKWAPAYDSALVWNSVPPWIYYLFLQNLVFRPMSIFSHYWMSPLWSLAVEEQFYFASPLLIRFLSPLRLTQVLVGCIAGAPILRYFLSSQAPDGLNMSYVLMPCRADALAMGMLAAVAWRTNGRAWLARHTRLLKTVLAILLCGALLMVKWLPGPRNGFEAAYHYSWLAAMYSCMMLVALVHREGILARIFRWRFLRELGRVSYCVYLIHLGILGTCHWVLLHSLPRINDWRGVLTTLLAAGITWGMAQSSWRYFEKPLIDRGHAFGYSRG